MAGCKVQLWGVKNVRMREKGLFDQERVEHLGREKCESTSQSSAFHMLKRAQTLPFVFLISTEQWWNDTDTKSKIL